MIALRWGAKLPEASVSRQRLMTCCLMMEERAQVHLVNRLYSPKIAPVLSKPFTYR